MADMLSRAGAQEDAPPRVSEAFADERIAEKIAGFAEPHQRQGMASLDRTLKERAVPPGVRLHLISAVAHLGHIAEGSLAERKARSGDAP